jgi:hypothetical protein
MFIKIFFSNLDVCEELLFSQKKLAGRLGILESKAWMPAFAGMTGCGGV